MKKRVVLLTAFLAICLALGLAPAIQAQSPVRVQLGFIIDGSGSMRPGDFDTLKYGLSRALTNESIVPRDGSVEICVVQIGVEGAEGEVRQEMAPIAINANNMGSIRDRIMAIPKGNANTPTAGGIDMCTRLVTGSPYFAGAERQVINILTDGWPNDEAKYPREQFPTDEERFQRSAADALSARDAAQAAGIDELDAEMLGIGNNPTSLDWKQFFRDLVYPKPVAWVPPDPMRPGFAREIFSYYDVEPALYEKLAMVLYPTPTPTPTLTATPTATWTPTPTATATGQPTATITPTRPPSTV
ncbi:MAG: vWA domain-containing protein, partial [Chloroflexota bacterium]